MRDPGNEVVVVLGCKKTGKFSDFTTSLRFALIPVLFGSG